MQISSAWWNEFWKVHTLCDPESFTGIACLSYSRLSPLAAPGYVLSVPPPHSTTPATSILFLLQQTVTWTLLRMKRNALNNYTDKIHIKCSGQPRRNGFPASSCNSLFGQSLYTPSPAYYWSHILLSFFQTLDLFLLISRFFFIRVLSCDGKSALALGHLRVLLL